MQSSTTPCSSEPKLRPATCSTAVMARTFQASALTPSVQHPGPTWANYSAPSTGSRRRDQQADNSRLADSAQANRSPDSRLMPLWVFSSDPIGDPIKAPDPSWLRLALHGCDVMSRRSPVWAATESAPITAATHMQPIPCRRQGVETLSWSAWFGNTADIQQSPAIDQ